MQGAPVQAPGAGGQGSQTLSPMQRFMNEATLRASQVTSSGQIQAPVALTQESVKDLAASITQQYNLRQNVIQQAVAAIEDAGQSASQIRINLQPASLGNLTVSLSMEGGKLTARLMASSNDVRDVLAANLVQFKQALEMQGLQVNSLSVAVRADAGGGGQQPQPQQAPWQQPQVQVPSQQEAELLALTNPWPSLAGGAGQGNSTFTALA